MQLLHVNYHIYYKGTRNWFKERWRNKKAIGSALYTSLVTDTGSFRHSNVTKRTHNIAAKLIEVGIDNSKIHSSLFDNKPLKKLN